MTAISKLKTVFNAISGQKGFLAQFGVAQAAISGSSLVAAFTLAASRGLELNGRGVALRLAATGIGALGAYVGTRMHDSGEKKEAEAPVSSKKNLTSPAPT